MPENENAPRPTPVLPRPRFYAYCDYCGHPIDCAEEAVTVNGSEDVIHCGCWEEYAEEHMYDYVRKAERGCNR